MITTHVIRPGDHLAKIAHERGLDPDEVWNHPKNAELREKRKDPHILCEGDVLFLPVKEEAPLPLQVGQANRYSAVLPRVETHLRLADASGPFANEAFEVEGLDQTIEGTTDADGNQTFETPVTAKVATVVLTNRRLRFTVLLGEMDPITEVSGVQLRLGLLGFLKGPASGDLDDATVDALRAFQKSKGLDISGAKDEATLDALKAAYGC